MKTDFQFSRLEMGLLITNALVFGACIILLLLGRASGPLILLTIGTFGMLAGKLGKAYYRARCPESPSPPTEKS